MPAAFDRCEREGGRIITKNVNKTQYIHVCYPKGGGSPVEGYVKTKKVRKVSRKENKGNY